MKAPTTKDDLQRLITNQVQESLHLDFKDSRALSAKWPGELSKDVSAFANSDGGVLIYGIREDNHVASEIDGGVDHTKFSKERLEQHLRSNIAPRIEGILIHRIPLAEDCSAYVLEVPKSHRAPHQDRGTMKYYKRLNFESVAMEDYELTDLRARPRMLSPLVTFDIEIRSSALFLFVISNPGDVPAYDVRFEFSRELTWDKEPPRIITNGIRVLPPRRDYRVLYGVSHEVLNEALGRCTNFAVDISYFHPTINHRISEVVDVNLLDYLGTWPAEATTRDLEDLIKKGLGDIGDQVKRVADGVQELTAITRGSGLQLSASTMEGIVRSFGHEPSFSKLDPRSVDESFIADTLGIDRRLAYAISNHFRRRSDQGLQFIPGMTGELIEKLRSRFIVDE